MCVCTGRNDWFKFYRREDRDLHDEESSKDWRPWMMWERHKGSADRERYNVPNFVYCSFTIMSLHTFICPIINNRDLTLAVIISWSCKNNKMQDIRTCHLLVRGSMQESRTRSTESIVPVRWIERFWWGGRAKKSRNWWFITVRRV